MWGATIGGAFSRSRRTFQSTRPVWGATSQDSVPAVRTRRFNPRAPCGARRKPSSIVISPSAVSIHAPRVGRDAYRVGYSASAGCFNPRAPCGARLRFPARWIRPSAFQSTRPVWGATCGAPCKEEAHAFQSTRPVWGATDSDPLCAVPAHVSIHAPRVGRDVDGSPAKVDEQFQSTRPVWGATAHEDRHARACRFQSTRPVWGATSRSVRVTHAERCFNPRAPCGARHILILPMLADFYVSIHAPRVGRDM